jgi:arylsulfatase A-like enzyme
MSSTRTEQSAARSGVGEAVALGALAGLLHGLGTATVLGWSFRDHVMAPPAAGRVQLFDPASKIITLASWLPVDFLQHFYGPGLLAKASLAAELATANLLLGAGIGLVLGALILRGRPRSRGRSAVLFALGFLMVSALLHVVGVVAAIVDPLRPRPLPYVLDRVARRMLFDGPAVDLFITAAALGIVLYLAPRLGPWRARWVAVVATVLAVSGMAATKIVPATEGAVAAPGTVSRQRVAVRPRNVVLISIDSLRADHLGSYGYHRPTSPTLDRLAAEGARFAAAYATSSWTLPSHATMLTGRYPLSHGAILPDRRLSAGMPTLATVLKSAGYTTGGFVSYEFLRRRYGFHAGFDHFDDFTTDLEDNEGEYSRATGPLLNAQIIPWVEANAGRPFFLFLHYFDVHVHYDPPPPYDTMFDPDYVGPDLRRFTHNPAIHANMPRRHLEHFIALYDGEIRHTDAVIGEVISTIERLGIGSQTLVIVTADHGDEFFEHGGKGHGKTLYEEVLMVPLLMRWPQGLPAGRVIDVPASLVDLAPTVYELVGLAPPTGLEGRSLVPFLFGEDAAPVAIYAHLHDRRRPIISATVRMGHEKYVQDLHAPRAELYDLERDPGEQENRFEGASAGELPGLLVEWLRQQWLAQRSPNGAHQIIVDRGSVERLRALGYVD